MSLKLLPAAYKQLKAQYQPDEDGNYPQAYENERLGLIMTLVIAYYNTGTECEHLKAYDEAKEYYDKGYEWSAKTFGPTYDISKTLKKCLFQIKKKLNRYISTVHDYSLDQKHSLITIDSSQTLGTKISTTSPLSTKIKSILSKNSKISKLNKLKSRATSDKRTFQKIQKYVSGEGPSYDNSNCNESFGKVFVKDQTNKHRICEFHKPIYNINR